MSKPAIGSCWRILAQQPRLSIQSANYEGMASTPDVSVCDGNQILDEVVIVFQAGAGDMTVGNATTLHLEQMDTRKWFLGLGDLKFSINVKKDRLEVMLYDGDETKFVDQRTTSAAQPASARLATSPKNRLG